MPNIGDMVKAYQDLEDHAKLCGRKSEQIRAKRIRMALVNHATYELIAKQEEREHAVQPTR